MDVGPTRTSFSCLSSVCASSGVAQATFLRLLGTFHKGVSEDVLLKQKEFCDPRCKLLRGATDFYKNSPASHDGSPDAPPATPQPARRGLQPDGSPRARGSGGASPRENPRRGGGLGASRPLLSLKGNAGTPGGGCPGDPRPSVRGPHVLATAPPPDPEPVGPAPGRVVSRA
jgi:hypothetical protein